MKKLLLISLLPTLLLTACSVKEDQSAQPLEVDLDMGPQYVAELTDDAGGDASGTVIMSATPLEGATLVTANFENLPELEEGFFYEGWLVRTEGELSVLSTGRVVDDMNFFVNELDLTDHNQYILTLEPDDGNPDPAEHVLSGTFSLFDNGSL